VLGRNIDAQNPPDNGLNRPPATGCADRWLSSGKRSKPPRSLSRLPQRPV